MPNELRERLLAIEADLDAGRYRPGPWAQWLRLARRRPISERQALAADVSRVSRKLHARDGLRTVSVAAAIGAELLATAAGGALLWLARVLGSNLVALAGAGLWITTFQPLIKVSVGTLLGVRYDYVHLRNAEPRFKMRYGTYLAAPRWRRVVLHLAGNVGSPLAAWLVSRMMDPQLPLASGLCLAVFWLTLASNALFFFGALAGLGRIGPLKVGTTSGGASGLELREALGWSA